MKAFWKRNLRRLRTRNFIKPVSLFKAVGEDWEHRIERMRTAEDGVVVGMRQFWRRLQFSVDALSGGDVTYRPRKHYLLILGSKDKTTHALCKTLRLAPGFQSLPLHVARQRNSSTCPACVEAVQRALRRGAVLHWQDE